MQRTASEHVQPIEALPEDIWPSQQGYRYRPALNIHALIELLQHFENTEARESDGSSDTKGKKRLLDVASDFGPSRKRIRSLNSAMDSSFGRRIRLANQEYPYLPATRIFEFDDEPSTPVIQHTFKISYSVDSATSKHLNDGMRFESKDYKTSEKTLREGLARLYKQGIASVDLGEFQLSHYLDRLVASFPTGGGSPHWIFLLPPFTEPDFDAGWYDLPERFSDIIFASAILHAAGRASISTHLQLTISNDLDNADILPFQFEFNVSVYLELPGLSDPSIHRTEGKSRAPAIDDAQRRILNYISPSTLPQPPTFDGSINIPFFYSVLGPAPAHQSADLYDYLQPPTLRPTLLPFQRRSVAWLLNREGKMITPNGEIQSAPENAEGYLPSFWAKVELSNCTFYFNRLNGTVSLLPPDLTTALGGILAEEPGLGKTLETITLIMLNPAPPERNHTVSRWDPEAKLEVKATKATLIVTPPALASQWAEELATHAPTLKVFVYDGWSKLQVPITKSQVEEVNKKKKQKHGKGGSKSAAKRKAKVAPKDGDAMDVDEDASPKGEEVEVQDWCSYVDNFDVVIVTYATLRSDFNIALAAPERPRRSRAHYSNLYRPRSPLVMVEWYRVVMDEVQMVGGGKVEDMVSLIPRLSSFAVSGTPARAQAADLIHVLKFLRVDHAIGNNKAWSRLASTGLGVAHFADLFKTYAIRTLKSQVKDELTIPQQTRYLVSVKLGPVERHVYDQALEGALLELGLDARGVAGVEGWEVDGQVLRSVIRRLRGICTHPQVGQLQRPNDKLHKPGSVKTMEEVLEGMREENWRKLMDDIKSKVQVVIRIAQLQSSDGEGVGRFSTALNTLIEAEAEVTSLIVEVQAALDKLGPRTNGVQVNGVEASSSNGKGKGRADLEDDSDEENSDPVSQERRKGRGGLQNRLRECRIVLHQTKFLQGDMYHSLGEAHAEDENIAYGAADHIRRDLLKGTESDAIMAMSTLEHDSASKQLTKQALLIKEPFLDDADLLDLREEYDPERNPGMLDHVEKSIELLAEGNFIIEDVLNQQSDLIWEWRTQIIALLTQGVSANGEQADGEEYQRTLDNQGEAETYLQAYAALLSDRRQTLTAERTLLAAHDVREKQDRHTRAAMHAIESSFDPVELQPEDEVLVVELSTKRKKILKLVENRAVKSILVELNAVQAQINKDKAPEKILLRDYAACLRRLISDQNSLMDKLDVDLALLRKAFNQRILYFRQLQQISDSVAEITWEGDLLDALTDANDEKEELITSIKTERARHRYLDNLATVRKTKDGEDEDEGICILCRCEFTRGFVTRCAHVFCEKCMKQWLERREGKTCPVCRVPIEANSIQRFKTSTGTVESQTELQAEKPRETGPIPKSRRQISYNYIDAPVFEDILRMDSFGDYGSKIQTLIRHLLYLKFSDHGSKSIVFSAWADSLFIMERALRENGIRCLRIDQKSHGETAVQRFKSNPDLLVLLLHGERENAGLNITCASRVFLLESVVHHGFEIQAIARIDRMGQTRPTEVYCYYAEDTVERNILDLAARKGLSLYTKENSAGTLNITSLGADEEVKIDNSPKKKLQKKGDFIFKVDDMLAILFPHMFEELEYLIPVDTNAAAVVEEVSQPSMTSAYTTSTNAIAGPSRLPYDP